MHNGTPRRRFFVVRLILRLFLYGMVLLILLAGAAGVAGYVIYDQATRPGVAGEKMRVTIQEGAMGKEVGRLLAEVGLLDHELLFRTVLYLDKGKHSIKHGLYDMPKGFSAMQFLEILDKGPNAILSAGEMPPELKVTVPEGLSLAQMAQLFDSPETFLKEAAAPELLKRLGFDTPTLEGFLFPNTYFFATPPTEREVIERMIAEFQKTWTALIRENPVPRGMTPLQIVTVASLVEEEARMGEERPLVAAVIYNRLRGNMTLDMDSTLQYSLGKYGQRLLDEDKAADSPYNTYKRRGLPPGPISCPGAGSLKAALAPAQDAYLFFVSNADGKTHTFSKTLTEHNAAVARFRSEIAKQRRAQDARE